MFSSTVRCGSSPPFWMTYPIWRRSVVLRMERSGVPSQVIRPVVGSSIRLTMRSVVVLPHPEGPTITVKLWEGTVRLRSTTAAVPSRNVLPTDSNSITQTPQVSCNSFSTAGILDDRIGDRRVRRTKKTLVATADNSCTRRGVPATRPMNSRILVSVLGCGP